MEQSTRRPAKGPRDRLNPTLHALSLALIIVFATGAFGGFFLTVFWPLTPENWRWVVGGRVLWQAGSAVLLGLLMIPQVTSLRLGLGVLATLGSIGALLSINPLLDLVRGPATYSGQVQARLYRSEAISADISIMEPGGQRRSLEPSGVPAERWEEASSTCDFRQPARLRVLRHLEVVLEVDCARQP